MNEGIWDETLSQMVDAHAAGESVSFDGLDDAQADEAAGVLDVADLLWEAAHGAPPLADDPVAAMLGLVPDGSLSLDGDALRRTLASAGFKVSVLAQRLADRGWDVNPADVFTWQQGAVAATVPPALIQAIAEVIGTSPDRLTVDRRDSPSHSALKALTSSQAFRALAERWAQLRGTSIDLAASALESRLAAAVFRGDQPDDAQMLASLEALVSALESEPGNGRSN
jgi:hypothetical protein